MSSDERAAMVHAFDAAATDFDRLAEHLWDRIGRATADAARLQPGERVLDACCGTGASARPAAAAVGPDGRVDAVDLSAPMIEVLNRAAADLPQLRGHASNVLDWPEGGYDAVLCALGIFFFPDMAAGTGALVGRARPGGRVVATIWRRGAMEAAGLHLGQAVAAVRDSPPPGPRPPHLVDRVSTSAATFGAWLTERGLDHVAVTVVEQHLPMTEDLAWLVITGSGFRAALAPLTKAEVEAVRQAYLGRLRSAGVERLDATVLIGTGTRPSQPHAI
jgi:SAM-dependent methyltransferase